MTDDGPAEQSMSFPCSRILNRVDFFPNLGYSFCFLYTSRLHSFLLAKTRRRRGGAARGARVALHAAGRRRCRRRRLGQGDGNKRGGAAGDPKPASPPPPPLTSGLGRSEPSLLAVVALPRSAGAPPPPAPRASARPAGALSATSVKKTWIPANRSLTWEMAAEARSRAEGRGQAAVVWRGHDQEMVVQHRRGPSDSAAAPPSRQHMCTGWWLPAPNAVV